MTRSDIIVSLMLLAPATIVTIVALVRGYDILIVRRSERRKGDD